MSIPTLTPKKTDRRSNVTRLELIKSLPVDKFVCATACTLDVSKDAFYQHMKKIPREFVDSRREGSTIYYKIKSRRYAALIAHLQPNYEKPKKQKIVSRKMTTRDKLHNLFEWA